MTETISRVRQEIPLAQPSITEAEIAAVVAVLRTPVLSLGPQVTAFEQDLAAYCGASYGIAVNAGTSGLHLGLAAAGIGPGDAVITSPFSFVASANCILYQGATPVFADIDEQTLNLDVAQVAAKIGPHTKALLPVDVFGQPADLEALLALAEAHDLVLLEDACEAIGAERHGKRVGSHGHAAVFAFYPNKQLTTGEGGMIVTADADYAQVLRSLANQGRDDAGTWLTHVRLGYNYRLDELSAALGRAQLARLDTMLAQRAQVAAWYAERLGVLAGVTTPCIDPATTRMSWFVYVIRLAPSLDRTAVMAALAAEGIPSRPYFVPLHLQPYYRQRFGYQPGAFPVTERVAATTLALPFF